MSHKQHYWRVAGQQIWRFLALDSYSKKTRTRPGSRGPLGALCMLLIKLDKIVFFLFAEWTQKYSGMVSGTCEEYIEGRDQIQLICFNNGSFQVCRYARASKTTYQRIGFTFVNKTIEKVIFLNNWNKTKRAFFSQNWKNIGLSYNSPQTSSFPLI